MAIVLLNRIVVLYVTKGSFGPPTSVRSQEPMMSSREKLLVAGVVFLLTVIMIVVLFTGRGKDSAPAYQEKTRSLDETMIPSELLNRSLTVDFTSDGTVMLADLIQALDDKIYELEREVIALKRELPRERPPPGSTTNKEDIAKHMLEARHVRSTEIRLADEIQDLGADKSFEIFTEVWPTLTTDDQKIGLLGAFSRSRHPLVVDIFEFGINDPSPGVQKSALKFLYHRTLKDFTGNIEAYREWRAETEGMVLDEIIEYTMAKKIEDAYQDDKALKELLAQTRRWRRQGEMLDLCEHSINQRSPNAVLTVLRHLKRYQHNNTISEEYLRRVVVPVLTDPDEVLDNMEIQESAMRALAGDGNQWAADVIMPIFYREFENDEIKRQYYKAAAKAIADRAKYDVIPELIQIIEDDPENAKRQIGRYALGRLTGVRYDESHDGEWWKDWWERNRWRFLPGHND